MENETKANRSKILIKEEINEIENKIRKKSVKQRNGF